MSKENLTNSPFQREEATHTRVLETIKKHPAGLSTLQIEQETNISRKAVEKHLQILLMENEVYVKQFGSTRVYYPNHRLHYTDFRYFDFKNRRIYFDIVDNEFGTYLLIQEKRKEGEKKLITKGSVLIPLEASEDFIRTLGNILKSKKIKEELKK